MEDIERFVTAAGRTIYMFPARAFPGLVANIFVISDGRHQVLVDCGSGLDHNNDDLLAGLARAGRAG